MLFRLVRPVRRKGSSKPYFQQRIPADIRDGLVGTRLAIPIGNTVAIVLVTATMQTVRVSLRTSDPAEAKLRQAGAVAYLETVWQAHRAAAPVTLTHKQATALAGQLYRAWATEEGEHVTSGTIRWDGKWEADAGGPNEEERRAVFSAVLQRWNLLGEERGEAEALEPALGSLVDRLLLARGIAKVEPTSRAMLLSAFWQALRDAFEHRQRNAEGDYSPDPKAGRFPEWSPVATPEAPKRAVNGGQTLSGLLEGWWTEGKAAGRSIVTYEAYAKVISRLIAFLGSDNADLATKAALVNFKDHRIAEGVSLKSLRDRDFSGLRSVFNWAVANGRLAENPAATIKIAKSTRVRLRSKAFTLEEAGTILRHALDHRPGRGETPKIAAAKRWVPWLCAYTGARVGELAQLRKEDVRQEGETWVLTITPEAFTVKDKEAREVVLHPHLVEQGFPAFVGAAKPGYLFLTPNAKGEVRGSWRALKNRISEFNREVVSDKNVAPNHAWRHLFKTLGREAEIADSVLDAICGHAPNTEGGAYGNVTVAAQVKAFGRFPRFDVASGP